LDTSQSITAIHINLNFSSLNSFFFLRKNAFMQPPFHRLWDSECCHAAVIPLPTKQSPLDQSGLSLIGNAPAQHYLKHYPSPRRGFRLSHWMWQLSRIDTNFLKEYLRSIPVSWILPLSPKAGPKLYTIA